MIASTNGLPDSLQYAVDVGKDVVVPEAQDREALLFKETGAGNLDRAAWIMLATIGLDYEPVPITQEVGAVGRDRRLTPKLGVRKRLAQFQPKQLFRIRHIASQLARAIDDAGMTATVLPHTLTLSRL